MPAKAIHENPLQCYSISLAQYLLPKNKDEVPIYLYNRICALEQKIKNIELLLRHQCESCQYKKVAENVKSILG